MNLSIPVLIAFGSMLSAQAPDSSRLPREDLRDVVPAITALISAHIFDASILKTTEYHRVETMMATLAKQSETKDAFIKGFNDLWMNGPVSHVRIDHAKMSANKLADVLDTMRLPGSGAVLRWEGDIAILTVYSMMGVNTIEEINNAYNAIHQKKGRALIIDLRKNEGGAFAVTPLVGHLLASDYDAGVFLSRRWFSAHREQPETRFIRSLPPWEGWSLKTFWNDVLENGVLRIVFKPMIPRFDGPVYVLTSRKTASAAELAADAIVSSGRGILIGEKTAGRMLSQKMFDVPNGLQLSLPVADYYSSRSGRIEGIGIVPSIASEAQSAMDKVLEMVHTGHDR